MIVVAWIKNHKLLLVIIAVAAVFVWKNLLLPQYSMMRTSELSYYEDTVMPQGAIMEKIMPPIAREAAPAPDVNDRLVIQNSTLSLLVKDVRSASDAVIAHAKEAGGYMVNSSLSNPGEAPSATVTIRVPSVRLQTTLSFLQNLSIRVVSENLEGTDVTDQYVDNEARLATLRKTQEKFEELFNRAIEISDILNIQRELINLQGQIEAVKGQQQYMEKTAEMARITIYLSTDEFSLPYAPSDAWRPEVIFKQAVRSLVGQLRGGANLVIWMAVYAVVWVPALVILLYIKKRLKK